MNLGLWIACGLVAWVVLPLPLAVLIGRLIASSDKPAVVPAQIAVLRPAPVREFEQVARVG